MMSLTVMVLTPDPLVCTLFAIFLCILMTRLVVFLILGLLFSHQQDLSQNMIFFSLTCPYQLELDHRNILVLKFLFISKFETQFYSCIRSMNFPHSLLPL